MGFLKEFKEFALKGNVMDLAIGVIIGGAFSSIVTALTDNVIQPLINLAGGAEVHGTIVLAKNAAGEVTSAIDYGALITAVINFIIVALVLFIIVKAINTAEKKNKEALEKLSKKVGKNKGEEAQAVEPTVKLCPYCLSEIPYKATKCAHCASELEEVTK